MIIVTSAPRCGSSMLMQTLALLGVSVDAPKFLPEHQGWEEYNPGGFYEENSESGITEETYKKGYAKKLFGGQLMQTDKKFIDKLIWIQRDREDAIVSYDKVRRYLPKTEFTSSEIHDSNIECILACIDDKTFSRYLDHIKLYPGQFLLDLVEYLRIDPTAQQIINAKNNIKWQ